jgi:hypothetical protein
VPSSATRPKAEGSPINALAALAWCGKFISVMRVILSARFFVYEVRYVVGAMLRSFNASERGLRVYSCAKGTLSHGVSVNRTSN